MLRRGFFLLEPLPTCPLPPPSVSCGLGYETWSLSRGVSVSLTQQGVHLYPCLSL